MTETKARFCNVCGKMVDKERKVRGKLKWDKESYSDYWQNKAGDITLCASCWRPLWDVFCEIGVEPLTQLFAWWDR